MPVSRRPVTCVRSTGQRNVESDARDSSRISSRGAGGASGVGEVAGWSAGAEGCVWQSVGLGVGVGGRF